MSICEGAQLSDLEKARTYREKNKDRIRAQRAAYYQRNKDKTAERKKAWYASHPGAQTIFRRRWRQKKKAEPTIEFWGKQRYHALQRRCRQSGVIFNITPRDLSDAFPKDWKCPVLGIPLVLFKGKTPGSNAASVDRLIPELGYVPGNIRVISLRANILKRDSTDPSELRAIADYMERNLKDYAESKQ